MEIKYSDLFSPDITTGIDTLIQKIGEVKTSMEQMVEDVKAKAQGLGDALSGSSSSTKGGRDNTQAQAAQAEALYQQYNQLKDAIAVLKTQFDGLTEAEKKNTAAINNAKTANDNYASVLERLTSHANLAKDALEGIATSGKKDDAEMKALTATVKALETQIKNLEKANKNASNAQNGSSKSASSQKKELLSLSDAYATLTPLIEKTGVDLNVLINTEKAHQQVSKNGEIANNSLAGSYNQLAAQYNLLKTALNSMSAEMRANTTVGKEWEAEALRIMDEMKAMQEATGKSTLSVGDYGKALNGLQISTQQVLREMPTLANSVQQFFIAISNNVPIFVDNFKRASAEMGGFTKAIGATIKALFSWQTVLLVVLTILPKIAKAISDKKKAQEEANKEDEKAITYAKLMAEAELGVERATVQSVGKLQFLTSVLRDNNRSMEDRIKAAKLLKAEFKEELQNFSDEEIAMGKATGTMQTLIDRLITQAQARAYLNEIGNLTIKHYELEQKAADARSQQLVKEGELRIAVAEKERLALKARQEVMERDQTTAATANALNRATNEVHRLSQAVSDAKAVWTGYDKEMQDVEAAMDSLRKRIKLEGLFEVSGGGKDLKDQILEIPSYYNDALKAIIDGMEEGLQKELALLDYGFKVEREKRLAQQAAMEELMNKATNDEKRRIQAELSNLAFAMVAEEQNYLETRKRMLSAMFQSQEVEETDPEQELIDSIRMRLQVVKNYQNKVAAMNYAAQRNELMSREHTLAEEVALVDEYNAQIIASEKEYWENFKAEMEAEGLELTDEYKEIMDKIASLTGKLPSNQTSTRKKRGSKNFRNLTEVAFALSPTFGEKDENGIPKIKDEYMDFANSINEALQTSIDYMDEWMDKRIEMAEIAVEKAQEESEAAKTALNYEMQARANGYANNVELARKEYEEKKRIEMEAIAEQKRLQKIQEGINTAQQIGSLVTATANIWSAYSSIPFAGTALAIAATALMWGSFLAAKIQAASLANAQTHGEGMAEYLDYGGSHASGHDIDFGHTKDGRARRVEKGEVVGVINKRNVQKYGVDKVLDIIRSLNNGTYDDHSYNRVITSSELVNNVFGDTTPENRANMAFLGAKVEDMLREAESRSMGLKMPFMDKSEGLSADYASAFAGLSSDTDLSVLERGMGALIEQGKTRVVQTSEGRIEYRGNNKRIIRNG